VALGIVAAVYAVGYLLAKERARRRPACVTVIAALRAPIPEEAAEWLVPAVRVAEPEPVVPPTFTVAYETAASGISLAPVVDETTLEAALGAWLDRAVFAPSRPQLALALSERRWSASLLLGLALEAIHRARPRSVVVDFRVPADGCSSGFAVAAGEADVDVAVNALEIVRRALRYSDYRDATVSILFCEPAGTWLTSPRGDSSRAPSRARS
jgi:hypothetical protein